MVEGQKLLDKLDKMERKTRRLGAMERNVFPPFPTPPPPKKKRIDGGVSHSEKEYH